MKAKLKSITKVGKKIQKVHERSSEISRIRKINGQLSGIEKMIQENKYCTQILQQILAASSALKALKIEVLKRYLAESLDESKQSGNYVKFNEQVLEIVKIQMRN